MMCESLALFEGFPAVAERVGRVVLGSFPTPVTPMPELARLLDCEEVWAKRDDRSARIYGGNKVRKLELVLADAIGRGHRRVWTVGGFGSHQVLATSLFARMLGLACSAVVVPQPMTEHAREVARGIEEAGCELMRAPGALGVPLTAARLVLRCRLRDGRAPYQVQPGASSVLGALGYVSAALELVVQIRQGECPRPGALFVAMGSMGTAAGLLVGLRLSGMDIPVYCVRVVPAHLAPTPRLAWFCRRIVVSLRSMGVSVPGTFRTAQMRVVRDQVGPGYGHVTAESQVALAAAAADGISLETTYTGKAMAALMHHVRQRLPGWRRVLFWNTFSSVGSPAGRSTSEWLNR